MYDTGVNFWHKMSDTMSTLCCKIICFHLLYISQDITLNKSLKKTIYPYFLFVATFKDNAGDEDSAEFTTDQVINLLLSFYMSRCVLEPPVLPADLFVLSPGYEVPPDLATFSMRGLRSRCPQRRFECSN